MIIDHEDISKASFRRVNSKTLDHLFLSQVEKGANCPPFVSGAILDVAKRVYHLHSSTKSQEQLKPGQYRVIGILSSEPAGKALEECRKGQALVTLDAGPEDREIRARFGIVAIRRARLLRRHTFASHMVMRGATMKELQELMGHKTMTMTMRYAHLSHEHKKKAVNLLNGLTAPAKKTDSHEMVTNSESSYVTTDLSY